MPYTVTPSEKCHEQTYREQCFEAHGFGDGGVLSGHMVRYHEEDA
jgi:hypothetical protein